MPITRKKIATVIFFSASLFMTWVLIGQIIQSSLTVDKLIKITGVIESTKEVTTHTKERLFYTHKDVELRIYLKDSAEYFRIIDVYKYQKFEGQIIKGDTAEIYIRPKWLVPLGMGYHNDIFQLNINGQPIFDISQTRSNTNGIIIVSLFAIPLFIFLGFKARK